MSEPQSVGSRTWSPETCRRVRRRCGPVRCVSHVRDEVQAKIGDAAVGRGGREPLVQVPLVHPPVGESVHNYVVIAVNR
jgi:hypothetical protein